MDTREAREKVIQAAEKFAPMNDELLEAIERLRSDELVAA